MAKTKARKQFEEEYQKVYKRIEKYIKRFSEIGWKIPKRLVPPVKEKATKEHYEKFKKIYIKDFREKLREIQSEEIGKTLKGKKAKKVGKEREKEWREKRKAKKTQDSEPVIPVVSFVDELISRLSSIYGGHWVRSSSGGRMFYTYEDKTNVLISVINDNLMNDGYIEYLNNNKERIIEAIDKWEHYDSQQEKLEYSFVEVFNLLDKAKLYDINEVAEELSYMTENYNPT